VYDFDTDQLTVVNISLKDFYPALPKFTKDSNGLIFQAYHYPHSKFGLAGSLNHHTKLFMMNDLKSD